MNEHQKEDFQELIQFKTLAEKREIELVEVITKLREAYLDVCLLNHLEANASKAYLNSLKY